MIIYSEKTNKNYNTVEECLLAEEEYDILKAREAEEEEKKLLEQKTMMAELKQAHEELRKASDRFIALRAQYINRYC